MRGMQEHHVNQSYKFNSTTVQHESKNQGKLITGLVIAVILGIAFSTGAIQEKSAAEREYQLDQRERMINQSQPNDSPWGQ